MTGLVPAGGMRLVAAMMALGCSTSDPARDASRDSTVALEPSAAPTDSMPDAALGAWYDRARVIDLTGDGQPDSARLIAVGVRPESLQIALAIVVGGEVKHREAWGSSYELALLDSTRRANPQIAAVLRARLDAVLASVAVERLDAPGVRLMAEDSATLARLVPRPTHRVSFAYGYESTTRLVWDAANAQFVRLWSCC
jgi:hypothetical protein